MEGRRRHSCFSVISISLLLQPLVYTLGSLRLPGCLAFLWFLLASLPSGRGPGNQ
nr:hypothetical protein Q903MT_gene3201 [Picea sitchensis]